MPPIFNDDYRKDLKHTPGYGYGRNVPPQGQPAQWVAERRLPSSSIIVHATHGTPGSKAQREAKFLRDSPEVSAHYLIGRDLVLYRILPPDLFAWHAGVVLPGFGNDSSIGIEIHAAVTEAILPGQHALLDELVRGLITTFRIPSDLLNTHRAVALPVGRKSDPATWPQSDFEAWRAGLYSVQPYTPDSPLLGLPHAPLSTVLANFPPGDRGGYSEADIQNVILPAYWAQASAMGLDPVLAIAQLAHETAALTSWWSQRPRRNPAGIGVTGETAPQKRGPDWQQDGGVWRRGVAFSGWAEEAIPAHLGRLLAYALPQGQGTDAQQRLITRALAYRSVPDSYRGSSPTLSGLGGRWAVPGLGYSQALVRWANKLIGKE